MEKQQSESVFPWGKCRYEVKFLKGNVRISCAQYDKRLQVSIFELNDNNTLNRTTYTEYFKSSVEAKWWIDYCLTTDKEEDLVFYLKVLKEREDE